MIRSIKSLQVALILILFMLALIIQFPAIVSQQWLESNHIKVNGINADRIEGGMLTSKLINERAKARKITKEKYMKGNLLKQRVFPEDVAEAFFNQILLKKTTGNIITVN